MILLSGANALIDKSKLKLGDMMMTEITFAMIVIQCAPTWTSGEQVFTMSLTVAVMICISYILARDNSRLMS